MDQTEQKSASFMFAYHLKEHTKFLMILSYFDMMEKITQSALPFRLPGKNLASVSELAPQLEYKFITLLDLTQKITEQRKDLIFNYLSSMKTIVNKFATVHDLSNLKLDKIFERMVYEKMLNAFCKHQKRIINILLERQSALEDGKSFYSSNFSEFK